MRVRNLAMNKLINKQQVAESFSKAATTYDSVASLQRDIGETLLQRIPMCNPLKVMDLGCGTGYFTDKLSQRFANAMLTGLDIAPGMLAYARAHRGLTDVSWVCADAEQLPAHLENYDLIFSSLAIQWCEDITALFASIHRALANNGVAFIATLGPDTLKELRRAWSEVDDYQHVNRFLPAETLLQALPQGLEAEYVSTEIKVLHYQQLKELTQELKGLGAHNMNAGRAKGLTGPARVKAFRSAYEKQRLPQGTLPATYEVYYLMLRKTHG